MEQLLKVALDHANAWSALMFCTFCLTVLGLRALRTWAAISYMRFSKEADGAQLDHAAAILGLKGNIRTSDRPSAN